MRFLFLFLLLLSDIAVGAALDPWATWSAAQPSTSKMVPPVALVARGVGTNTYYVIEVDATTGAIPVSATVSIDFDGTPGAAVPSLAGYMGGTDGTNLRGLKTDSSGELQVDVLSSALPADAATQTTLAALNTKVPANGQGLMAASIPVVIASDQTVIPASQSGTWNVTNVSGTVSLPTGAATSALQTSSEALLTTIDTDTGAISINTNDIGVDTTSIDTKTVQQTLNTGAATAALLVTTSTRQEAATTPLAVRLSNGSAFTTQTAGRSKVDLITYDHATPVTTSAYTQIIASTSGTINQLHIFDSSGEGLILATGAAASEVNVAYIPPGGLNAALDLAIPSGTRLSIKALTAATASGNLMITGLN